MQVWPAIDLKGGKCVRLTQGDYHREKVYGTNPADMAARWVTEGATGLHVIDLDGAMGVATNQDAVARICSEIEVDIQVGGGIRSEQAIEDYLSMGIKRLIVSSKTISDPQWIRQMATKYENLLVVSIDLKQERLAFDGWQKTSDIDVLQHAKAMAELPIAGLIVTDISRAGMLTGPNLELLDSLIHCTEKPLISSGGVRHTEDVERLTHKGVHGCVVGKALYDGQITLPQTIAAAALTDAHSIQR